MTTSRTDSVEIGSQTFDHDQEQEQQLRADQEEKLPKGKGS